MSYNYTELKNYSSLILADRVVDNKAGVLLQVECPAHHLRIFKIWGHTMPDFWPDLFTRRPLSKICKNAVHCLNLKNSKHIIRGTAQRLMKLFIYG